MQGQSKPVSRFTLIQDNDCHWFIIPAEKKQEFNVWLESVDAELGISPEWAFHFGSGPEQVTFTNPEIFGRVYE